MDMLVGKNVHGLKNLHEDKENANGFEKQFMRFKTMFLALK
jgi:hypothetical protein